MKNLIVFAVVMFILAGCAPISQQAKDDLAQPINCATAEEDVATLEAEKANVLEEIANGATAVVPAGAVISILTLTEKDKLAVATGHYNRTIDKKTKQIKQECGID